MSINQLIAAGIQLPRFESPINMMAQLSQLESAREANELRRMQMQKLQREESQLNALGQLASRGQNLSLADVTPFGQQGLALLKAQRELSTAAEQEAEKKQQQQSQRLGVFGKTLYQVARDPSDENLMAVRQSLSDIGISGPEIDRRFGALQLLGTREDRRPAIQQMLMSIPGVPEYLAAQDAKATETSLKAAQAQKAFAEARQVGAPKPTADMQNYEEAKRQGFQGTFMDYKQALRPAPVSVSVGAQEGALQRKLGEAKAGIVEKGFETAQDARSVIETLSLGRQILNQGATTGFGANFLVNVGQALKQVGVDLNADASANAQTYMATMAQNVGRIIKQFGAGTGLSNADREYAEKMAGGNIALDERALRRILDINDKLSRNVIAKHNENVKKFNAGDEFLIQEPETPARTAPVSDLSADELRRMKPTKSLVGRDRQAYEAAIAAPGNPDADAVLRQLRQRKLIQ